MNRKRDTILGTVYGEVITTRILVERYNVSYVYLKNHLTDFGETIEEVVQRLEYHAAYGKWWNCSQEYDVGGMLLTIPEMTRFLGINETAIYGYAIRHKVTVSRAFLHFYNVKHGTEQSGRKVMSDEERREHEKAYRKKYYYAHHQTRKEHSLMRYYANQEARKAYNREYRKAYYRRKKAERSISNE